LYARSCAVLGSYPMSRYFCSSGLGSISSSCQPGSSDDSDRLGDDDLSPPMKNSPERTRASISACYDRGILDFGDQLITAKTYHANKTSGKAKYLKSR